MLNFKLATNLEILKISLYILKPFCCKSVRKRPLQMNENPYEAGELTLTYHCKGESKNIDGQKRISRSNDLL